jgi:putative adenylate-forming enzyme
MILRILRKRRDLRKREQWDLQTLRSHQEQALTRLRTYALAHSPFYSERHRGLEDAPLTALPAITKRELMTRFDEVVTDRSLHLSDLERYLSSGGDKPLADRYWVAATSGSSGLRAIVPTDRDEWASIIASYARANEWAGVRPTLCHRARMAVVSSRSPWHQSARVGATIQSPLVNTLRLDAGDPVPETVTRLNAFEPEVLIAYASVLRILAEEQLAGHLLIHPKAVNASSEVLTPHTRELISQAWGVPPFEVYAATETGGIAAECARHRGMHVFEDLVLAESVDDDYQPVPDGETGSRLLVTVLHSRTLPLIRYELTDRVRVSKERCGCGLPFRMIEAVEGRTEDVLVLPAVSGGGQVRVHPVLVHQVLDPLRCDGFQVRRSGDALEVSIASALPVDLAEIERRLREALVRAGAAPSSLLVTRVPSVAAGAASKRPLIR